MEEWEKKHIQENLLTLIETTACNVALLSKLRADGILSPEETKSLQNQSLDDYQKSQKLYQIVETRRDGFRSVKQALLECQQTGAYDILNKVNDIVSRLGGEFKNYGSISYDRQAVIGNGSNNTKVFKGRVGSRDVAVKKISLANVDLQTALEEVARLKELDWHENIVRYFNTEITDQHILIAFELCSIDLDKWVESKSIAIDRVEILRQATRGIQHLHKNNVIHRDIKPTNILLAKLLSGEIKVKISDFGISKKLYAEKSRSTLHTNTFGGTVGWVAPEAARALDTESTSDAVFKMYFATDVFALGCVFYFVLTDGQHPFGNPVRRGANIIDYKFSLNEASLKCSEDSSAFSIIREMIRERPKERLASSEILLHHFFWSKKKTLQFISDVSYVLNANFDDSAEPHRKTFRSHSDYKNWLEKVSEPVKLFLMEKTTRADNTIDLIDAIIFLKKNYQALPKTVQDELGIPPEDFGNYWFTRFNNLVPMAWLCLQNLRCHHNLEKYYPKEHIFENHFEALLEKQEGSAQALQAQVISGTDRVLYNKPNKRGVPVNIAGTGDNCNLKKTYEWVCKNCMRIFDHGFDRPVSCDCGGTPVICLKFKCTDPKHGLAFEHHSSDFLIKLVETLRPFKEMNILILGETGVGKSTWINGFINLLTFELLEEAEKGELCALIPSEFTVWDESRNSEILVSTGADKNEVLKTGQSTTQGTKVYPFNIGNTTIRLIDTPGIGDTRGIEQDKQNFQNILGTLSNLEELHGICILLKPNNLRLNVMLRFCIKELLTYLHRDASQNIMFCFTNSRGTFYRPGDTMPALKSLLMEIKDVEIPISRNTVFCYDSEAYRFLAAVKNDPPVNFPDDEKENFSNSWKKSIAETLRMLEHIKGLPAHKIKSTLNLNHSRQLVLRLARPLAEISINIQTNKSYREGLHVSYHSLVSKQVEDSSVEESLNRNLFAAEMMRKMIEAKNQEVKVYEEELTKIEQASVRFAYFLKSNAIMPYNDAMEQYLCHLIREEEDKACRGGNMTTLDNLKVSLQSYRAQKELLEKQMEKGVDGSWGGPPGAEVDKLVKELQKLKHSGKMLKDALESVEHNRLLQKEIERRIMMTLL